ncbi:hypothetical protein BDZ94DRAFT_1271238 [Collybia nuda]|uniref:Uncharacterized protein n=1 Tax=Collybia nuda TaxID=64659 RepID=A0A9P6CEP3_9AGAR|nr:hypothetical protein BDZ94DRAFT_1271238 [Collybia nuda]
MAQGDIGTRVIVGVCGCCLVTVRFGAQGSEGQQKNDRIHSLDLRQPPVPFFAASAHQLPLSFLPSRQPILPLRIAFSAPPLPFPDPLLAIQILLVSFNF